MSDTPRTHAKYMELIHSGADFTHPANVMMRFAEELERELAQVSEALVRELDAFTKS